MFLNFFLFNVEVTECRALFSCFVRGTHDMGEKEDVMCAFLLVCQREGRVVIFLMVISEFNFEGYVMMDGLSCCQNTSSREREGRRPSSFCTRTISRFFTVSKFLRSTF